MGFSNYVTMLSPRVLSMDLFVASGERRILKCGWIYLYPELAAVL